MPTEELPATRLETDAACPEVTPPATKVRPMELLSRVAFGHVATSMRAMPFVAPARHLLTEDGITLRMHAGLGYQQACAGSVVAYGADNFNSGDAVLWSVQCTGTAEIIEPTQDLVERYGPGPRHVDDAPFEPVYMRLVPQFVTVHVFD